MQIRNIQTMLARLGFNPGVIDGILGEQTKDAMLQALGELEIRMHPSWLSRAISYEGLIEYKGKRHNPKIVEWWSKINAPFTDDETPWCAAFVGGVLEEDGYHSTRSAMARSYLKWGIDLGAPCVGAIVVFWRGSPNSSSGHVGFVVGRNQNNDLMVLGGNQSNKVTVMAFDTSRVLSYRWPEFCQRPYKKGYNTLPLIWSDGDYSNNEA